MGYLFTCVMYTSYHTTSICHLPRLVGTMIVTKIFLIRPCLVRKNFQDSPSHRIFSRMYGALNIDENKN